MQRDPCPYSRHFEPMTEALTTRGLLLGSYDAEGKPNAMTIGWASLGSIWGLPILTVLVRPSRYTYACIEHTGCFTVNVPGEDLGMACAVCGSRSGRDINKFSECGLTEKRAGNVLAPVIDECPLVYECQVVHRNDVQPERLADEILTGAYTDGDYHRVYYGQILHVEAAPDVSRLLTSADALVRRDTE